MLALASHSLYGRSAVCFRGGRMSAIAAIILAAGQGTRMKSAKHKVLHPIAGRPMLMHLMANVNALAPARKVVVVGSGRDQLEAALVGTGTELAVQDPQHGTGHAVQQAETALAGFSGDVLILYGDVPFVPAATMQGMIDRLNAPDAPGVVVLAFAPDDTQSYGRVITDGDRIVKMVEHKDATEAERACRLCNSGLMAVKAADLFGLLARVTNENAAGEYYLVDIVNIANADGRHCAVVATDPFDVAGINSRAELAVMEGQWQQRRRRAAMADGATLIAPKTVWFAYDTIVGRDVTIEPNVFFGPGVSIADGATIRAFSHIEGAQIGAGAEIGPFARLRPGTVLGEKSKIGNFVEVKKSVFGTGAKANHLSYIGDADVGAGANIGAGTITCNYDGFFKYKTVIGDGAFIGSNSALVAPVTIGAGAIVGAGAVVTADVSADALALVRPAQTEKVGWAARFRAVMGARKNAQ
jgi:bifunctional UDP-N-acetylglucosamine pyrophosphorylase / glucosamine-1-phosphate N-acetyltransferase